MQDENIRSAIVLCGGMSRRMGEDKGAMLINEKPMILHVLEQLNNQIDEAVIVLNDNKRIARYKEIIKKHINDKFENEFSYEIFFVEDEIKNQGPLSGIMTGLKNINSRYGIVFPCDSPFISSEFVKIMFNILNQHLDFNIGSIIPYHDNLDFNKKIKREIELPINIEFKNYVIDNSEPLHGIYNKNNIDLIYNLLNSDIRHVKSLLKIINSYFILIDNDYIDENSFKNINTKKDLK